MAQKISNKIVKTDTLTDSNIGPDAVGQSEIKTGAVIERHYGALSIPSAALKDSSITTTKQADRSVTGIKVAVKGLIEDNYGDVSIPTTAYKDGSLTTIKYADRSMTGIKIALATVGLENMADASVDGRVLKPASVTDAHVVTGTLTPAKFQNGTAGDILVAGTDGVFARTAKGPENSVLAIKGGAPVWTTSILTTGMVADYLAMIPPDGWVSANGKTIGNAGSSATERANADCVNLFKFLWTNFPNNVLAVSGGRGASADADWAANKTITLPDMRGRATVGQDALNNSASGRLPAANAVGVTGGVSTNTISQSHIPAHDHVMFEYDGVRSEGYVGGGSANSSNDVIITWAWINSKVAYEFAKSPRSNAVHNVGRTSKYGSSSATPLDNMPPFFALMKMIKL